MALVNKIFLTNTKNNKALFMEKIFEIKISGSGSREEIAKSLREIADAIHHSTSNGDGLNVYIDSYIEWEDATLMGEMTEK